MNGTYCTPLLVHALYHDWYILYATNGKYCTLWLVYTAPRVWYTPYSVVGTRTLVLADYSVWVHSSGGSKFKKCTPGLVQSIPLNSSGSATAQHVLILFSHLICMVLFSLVLLCFLFYSCCVIRVHDNCLHDNYTTTIQQRDVITVHSIRPLSRSGGWDEHGEYSGAPDVGGAVEPSGGGGCLQYADTELLAFRQHVLGPPPSAWRYVVYLLFLYSLSILFCSLYSALGLVYTKRHPQRRVNAVMTLATQLLLKSMETRKSFCVNARDIPPAA